MSLMKSADPEGGKLLSHVFATLFNEIRAIAWETKRSETCAVLRLELVILGFVPIASLCLALFNLVPLHTALKLLVLPSMAAACVLSMRYPTLGREALLGLIAGMGATGVYDLARLVCILAGVWGDFIPVLGRMALDDPHASPLYGYIWRYVANGGAMGVAFTMLRLRGVGAGMLYGTAICCCLFGTLLWAPGAQRALFPLTPMTAFMALIGHLVYGAVLGQWTRLWAPSRGPTAQKLRQYLTYPSQATQGIDKAAQTRDTSPLPSEGKAERRSEENPLSTMGLRQAVKKWK